MANFENFAAEAEQLESEIARKGIIVGIDWDNEPQVRKLARQALACHGETIQLDCNPSSPEGMAKLELFGLAQLMLKVMEQSADGGVLTHGGKAWKAFARALWQEMGKT
ncbi:MAG: hypothetical protein M0P39_10815 [Rhodocyclaceae bacterium]|jgi:hypothetical protein|nr:hypothetical protein [Rhodocyclaceae bacterium]